MKLTNKQYLIDITLKSIQVKPTKQLSKISCEVHYGDNYLKMKLQPTLKNGIANFYEQRIRIPYATDVALVFKMLKSNKTQVFLGHFPLQLEKYLKQKKYSIQIRGQNLQETDAKVFFDCRIIDKAIFNSDSQEIQDQQIDLQKKKQDFSTQQRKFYRKPMSIKPLSELDRPFAFLKKTQQITLLLNEEFSASLQNIKQILSKRELFECKHSFSEKYKRDEDGFLRSDKIQQLENRLLKLRQDERIENFLIYSIIAGISFVFGFMTA